VAADAPFGKCGPTRYRNGTSEGVACEDAIGLLPGVFVFMPGKGQSGKRLESIQRASS